MSPLRRLLVLTTLVVAVSGQQKAAFDKKVTTLITTYLAENEPKATDLVVSYLVQQSTWDEMTSGLMSKAMSLVPVSKGIPAAMMLASFTNCLKSTGVSLEQAMGTLSAAFKKILIVPYNKIIKKMKAMDKAKKTDAQKANQAYKIATAALTKKLVQKMLNAAKAKSTQAAWTCALTPLNTIMLTSKYNMVWTASG